MPGDCSNSWQAYGCDWTVGYLWRSSDLFDRLVFVALGLLLAYTVFVLGRFCFRYTSTRRECSPLGPTYTQRSKGKLLAHLNRGLGNVRAIASIAPYLGLAGTCDGVTYRLMGMGMAVTRDHLIAIVAAAEAAALITTIAGIVVAISATLSYNLLTRLIERFRCELASTTEPIGRFRGFAQTLPLQRRFPSVPPYALIAAPILAILVAVLTLFQPYVVPTGLPVRLLPIGVLDKRQALKPIVVSVVSESGNGTAVSRVNSKTTSLDDLEKALVRAKGASKREMYVEADSSFQWGDVARVIDIAEGVGDGYVVLLTTTPNAGSGKSPRR